MTGRITERYGPRAWLVRFGTDLSAGTMARALAVSRELEEHPPEGLLEFTMGYASVLLEYDREVEIKPLAAHLLGLPAADPGGSRVDIPVVYDGEDLDEVAERTGLSRREVIRRHSGCEYRVWLLGFAPGFPYLGVLDEALRLPRRETPRPLVAAGSVAIAGMQTGIYPSASAGGWHIIGRTARRIFDPSSPDPFLLKPGDTVRFREADDV